MKFRKLRIAWSVAWGLLILLLFVLWVTSYARRVGTEIFVSAAYRYHIYSVDGAVLFTREGRLFRGRELSFDYPESYFSEKVSHLGLKVERGSDGTIYSVGISYWLPSIVTLLVAAAPWPRLRFSLRTLLVATTLVAVALGAVVYALRS